MFASDAGSTSTGRERLDAFRERIGQVRTLKAGRPLLGSFSLEFGREVVEQLIRRPYLPDAIVCGADILALGVIRALGSNKVDVPGETKVTGFDGVLFTELCDPPLTTLRQPVPLIAEEVARLLVLRLQGDQSPPRRSQVAPTLIVRRSSSDMASEP